jgi:hypothetical protein
MHPVIIEAVAAGKSGELQALAAAAQRAKARRSCEAGAVGLLWLWGLVADAQRTSPPPCYVRAL